MKNHNCALCGIYPHPKACQVAGCDAPSVLDMTPDMRFTLCEPCFGQLRALVTSWVGPQDAREGLQTAAESTNAPPPALPHEPGGLESSSEAPASSATIRGSAGGTLFVWVSCDCVRVQAMRWLGAGETITPEQADQLADALRQAAAEVRGEPAVPEPGTEAWVRGLTDRQLWDLRLKVAREDHTRHKAALSAQDV